MKLLAAKTTMPMRSDRLPSMKSATTSFATARRFLGLKSSAFMLPETSMASMMSMPSVSTVSVPRPACGLARASTTRASAAALSVGARKRFHTPLRPETDRARTRFGNETTGRACRQRTSTTT